MSSYTLQAEVNFHHRGRDRFDATAVNEGDDGRSSEDTGDGVLNPYVWSSSVVRREVSIYRWKIENFRILSTMGDCEMVYTKLSGGVSSNNVWRLNANLNIRGRVVFFLHLLKCGDNQENKKRGLHVNWSIILLDSNGEAKMSNSNLPDQYYEVGRRTERFIEFSRNNIDALADKLLEDGALKISIQVDIKDEFEIISKGNKTKAPRIIDDFKQLLSSKTCSDVTINTSTKEFKAHKAILCCRSSVFAAMFQNQMTESVTNVVEIKDLSDDVVGGILEFIYSGEVTEINDKAIDLLQVADRYDLNGLKEMCENAISNTMNMENALEVLAIADLHNAKNLKTKAIAFINRNKSKVRDLDKLATGNPSLMMELYLSK